MASRGRPERPDEFYVRRLNGLVGRGELAAVVAAAALAVLVRRREVGCEMRAMVELRRVGLGESNPKWHLYVPAAQALPGTRNQYTRVWARIEVSSFESWNINMR